MMGHDSEKGAHLEVEDVGTIMERKNSQSGDYSGAVAKTDEREIALVRKLDMRIMPTLFAMYFL